MTDTEALTGTDAFPETVDIGGTAVDLGDIVRHAFEASGLGVEAWNAQEQEARDLAIEAAIEALREAAAEKLPDSDSEHEDQPLPETVTVTVTDCPETDGVRLAINGRRFHLPVGKPVPLPRWALSSLKQVHGIVFTEE